MPASLPFDGASAPVRPPSAHGPMDLVCERASRQVPRRRSGDRVALSQEEDSRVRLPNTRYPMPPPAIIRRHCAQAFEASRGWGSGGPDALDIALNVMAAYLPFRISDRSGAVRVEGGAIVSRQAAQLYRAFCDDFLAQMGPQGGVVDEATIRRWISERESIAELAA